MKQGIIASPRIFRKTLGGFEAAQGLSKEQMHHLLLYWDRIIIPTHQMAHFAVPDEVVLLESGIIERPRYSAEVMTSKTYVQEYFEFQRSLSKRLSTDNSTNWSIHQFSNQLQLDQSSSTKEKIIQFELRDTLPVPSDEVSIYEVLEFKQRRASEFLELNHTLEELYQGVVTNPDPIAANIQVQKNLKKAIQDVQKSYKEKFPNTKKFSVSAQLKIEGDAIMKAAAVGAILDQTVSPLQFPIGTILGGAASLVQISCKYAVTFNSPASGLNLSYLSRAKSEKII